jgi:hypothetical protein
MVALTLLAGAALALLINSGNGITEENVARV